jgi:hypothetical protein
MAVFTLLNLRGTRVLNKEEYSSLTAAELVLLISVEGCIRLDFFRDEHKILDNK